MIGSRGYFGRSDWRELGAIVLLVAAVLVVLSGLCYVGYTLDSTLFTYGGWRLATVEGLLSFGGVVGYQLGVLLFVALGLLAWHRSAEVLGVDGADVHLRHFGLVTWIEPLFLVVSVGGLALMAGAAMQQALHQVALPFGPTLGQVSPWSLAQSLLEGFAAVLIGIVGALATRKVASGWGRHLRERAASSAAAPA